MLTCDVSINFFYTSCVDNDEYKIYMLEIFHRSNRMRLLPIISIKNFGTQRFVVEGQRPKILSALNRQKFPSSRAMLSSRDSTRRA